MASRLSSSDIATVVLPEPGKPHTIMSRPRVEPPMDSDRPSLETVVVVQFLSTQRCGSPAKARVPFHVGSSSACRSRVHPLVGRRVVHCCFVVPLSADSLISASTLAATPASTARISARVATYSFSAPFE